MRIGFIGFGNMAQALANGLVYKNAISPEQIYASAKNWDKLCENTMSKGFIPCRNSLELVEHVDMVVIAVKPNLVKEVITPIKEYLVDKIVISVVVNFTFDDYEEILAPNTHHLSTLPNTPVSIGDGIIVCETKSSLTAEEYDSFANLFSQIALIENVDTKNLGIAGTISGCGPAFTSMYIEALSDAAVLHGLPRDISYKLASKMVVGTGNLQLQSNTHPGVMKDEVCSPGGTTIVGVTTLERKGFRSSVIDAIAEIQKK
ncbi:pyrroline-5-carboxylate reductase [Bacillus sp. Marseille-P3661]|uniref:pyrroline-5-carboxylate reductase n=1 Tax=Bacillus sp. Marseille-P3661 TaxID=1936234 RepID=UPI000C84C6A3|nr:pyrroline-5-carboxylate reductase [Bacillus sp. Marseille-P3661]